MNKEQQTNWIKEKSIQLGFDACGIAKAERLDSEEKKLTQWLTKHQHGEMKYMENHFEKRLNPCLLVDGAKSVITLIKNYFPEKKQTDNTPNISKYAFGKDYHEVIREKLKLFLQDIQFHMGEVQGRGFVDSAPVLERAWAVKSGLGWIGKNGNLILKKQGSFYFIATLIIDLPLVYDQTYPYDYCGTCTQCIDACPTNAILPNKIIDGSKCISYYTIELKEAIQTPHQTWQDWVFGCDICQDICPWNRFSKAHQEEAFMPFQEILSFSIDEWKQLGEEQFNYRLKHSPLKRAGYKNLLQNMQFISKK
ncbi:MAG: tRNA epoxyqueuosine(34) reductase QueG [Chitinophagaceae bacterium]